jgi:ATP-binding protein involved in chromosome partitioning
MPTVRDAVEATLRTVRDPNTEKDFITSRAVRCLRVDDGDVHLEIALGYPADSQAEHLRAALVAALRAIPGVRAVSVDVTRHIVPHAVQRGIRLLPGVRNVIAVASGKGGVGKSTTAVNLALALAAEGAGVGILDADLYGPSQPQLLNLVGARPEASEKGLMKPLRAHGLQVMSIGFLVETETPIIWRGPLVVRALDQLMTETQWRDLDYLIVDLPPGTGDVQLSLAQKMPVTGAVIVTTPQDLALLDAVRGLKMFEKVGIPILGVIENMSVHICSQCGHVEHVFGAGGAKRICAEHGTELLGNLPLDLQIRELADSGQPTVIGAPDSAAAALYRAIARKIAIRIAERPKDMQSKFPNIVVESPGASTAREDRGCN